MFCPLSRCASRPRALRWVILLLGLSEMMPSCARGPRAPTSQETLQQLRGDVEALQNAVRELQLALDEQRRLHISERYCKDGTVARFMDALRTSPLNACAEVDADNALNFMHTQRWVFAWLRPDQGLSSLHPTRVGAIQRNLKSELLHLSTRVLVMVQPNEETLEAEARALRLGDAIREKVKELLPDDMRQTHVMPTYRLPCTLQRSRGKLKRYRDADGTPYSESLPGEPTKKEPRVAVWIFFTDC